MLEQDKEEEGVKREVSRIVNERNAKKTRKDQKVIFKRCGFSIKAPEPHNFPDS